VLEPPTGESVQSVSSDEVKADVGAVLLGVRAGALTVTPKLIGGVRPRMTNGRPMTAETMERSQDQRNEKIFEAEEIPDSPLVMALPMAPRPELRPLPMADPAWPGEAARAANGAEIGDGVSQGVTDAVGYRLGRILELLDQLIQKYQPHADREPFKDRLRGKFCAHAMSW